MGWGTFQAKSEVSIVKVFPAFIQSFPKTVMARSHAVDRFPKTVMARSHAVDRAHCLNAPAEAFIGIPACFT